ncbi:SCO3242 family prenyltransferase [Streptomyces sp. BPTC-684]|uniref:SCO3242 family prenyltransferase n=1 Tax=Streptomyces sp. BPTC-684 TaxID=3043734 RepID=UPI0024B2440F|nr:UbiA family prenyltransferase [Streptomyces sp. BPTC-684]WHM36097.1 UbiA family prenyltransferase [Streptomyces sp. BPTC-684]
MKPVLRDWAELLRISALFTVPGDALAGAASAGLRPNRRTALAVGSSLCLYEAGMALNDWADREEDAVDRPHRPIPSGRVRPAAALAAAAGLTGAGLALAYRAGRPAGLVATALAGTVWAYDLRLKHTAAGPAAMAAARSLDLLLGATATTGKVAKPSLLPATALGAHTYAVTTVSRNETQGGSAGAPLAALGLTTALGALAAGRTPLPGAVTDRPVRCGQSFRWGGTGGHNPPTARSRTRVWGGAPVAPRDLARAGLAATYIATAAKPYFHAALNPSPPLTQRAVGGGIKAMIPLQAALAARSGSLRTAAALTTLIPVARKLARKVSPT